MRALLSLLIFSFMTWANLTEPEPRLSCIDVNVRSTCALARVTLDSILDATAFIHSCVGLTVLVGEGLWPFKRWSTPRVLEEFARESFLVFFTRDRLRIEGDATTYQIGEIFCPAEAVDVKFLPGLHDQLIDRDVLKVGDTINEGAHAYLIDGLHVNRSNYVYATLRDQTTGQTIARTLN